MKYFKLDEKFVSDACKSLVEEKEGEIHPLHFLGKESNSGLSMEVSHTSGLTTTLMIRVSDLIHKIRHGKEIPHHVSGTVVCVSEDTHCHTIRKDWYENHLDYQMVSIEEVEKGLLEWEDLRLNGIIPTLEERIKRWGPVLGEGLRRATRPWIGDRRTGAISYGEFQGRLDKADVVEVFDDNLPFIDFHCEIYNWEIYILREYPDGKSEYIPQYRGIPASSEDEDVIEIDAD